MSKRGIAIPRSNSVQTSDYPLLSHSPPTSFHPGRSSSLSTSPNFPLSMSSSNVRQPKVLHPLDSAELRFLLLENISQDAVKSFKDMGFQVDFYPKAWSEDELVEKIGSYHAIGIRSKTKITERVLKAASKVSMMQTTCKFELMFNMKLASGYWVFLYWNQSGRPRHGSESWNPRFQLPLLQFPLSRRISHF